MAETAVLDRDVSYAARQPAGDVEEEQDLHLPDDKASWALALLYAFENGKGKELRERAKKMFRYVNGDQWDPTVRSKLEDAENPRPVMTFNEIRAKVKLLSGEERRNREDWVAKPREGSDEAEAEVRTALLKYKRDQNNLVAEESRVFDEGIIGGFGGVACDLVPSPDGGPPLIHVEARDWSEFRWDLDSRKPDMTDAQWIALSVMGSPDRLSELFPEWDAEIASEYANLVGDPLIEEADIGERIGVSRYLDGRMRRTLFNEKERKIRIVQFYYRAIRKREVLSLQTPQGPREREVPEDNPEMRALADQLILSGRARRRIEAKRAIRGLLIVGRRTLAQWWSPFEGQDAFGIPYFPIHLYKASDIDGYIMGVVEPMVSPQDEINKRWTMMVENYLHQARSGGKFEENAFINESEAKKMWGSPGYWAKLTQGAISQNKVQEHVAKPPDTALMMLFQAADAALDRISNLDRSRMGMLSREESGVAIRTRAVQSALVQVTEFDNFRNFQLRLGRFLNANLHLEFPVRRTMRLVMPTGDTQLVTLNEMQRTETGAVRVANDTRTGGLYDIVMDLTPGNATFREMQSQNLANLMGQIVPPMKDIPQLLPVILEVFKGLMKMLDGLPNRDAIIQSMDAAIRSLGQIIPGGMPGAAPGEPSQPGTPPPMGLPFTPATMTPPPPGPIGASTVMGMPPFGEV